MQDDRKAENALSEVADAPRFASGEDARPEALDRCSEVTYLLATSDLFHQTHRVFLEALEQTLSKIAEEHTNLALLDTGIKRGDLSSSEGAQKVLLQPLSQDIMNLIWKESEFVSESELSQAGLAKTFCQNSKPLTKNALANELCDRKPGLSAATVKSYSKQVERVCLALEVFGLVQCDRSCRTRHVISGTVRLHNLMSKAYLSVGEIYSAQISGEDSADV